MPLIYRVDIVDNYIDMEEDEDTDDGHDVSFETEELSYNLTRPAGGAPILAKSEAVAAAEFRAIVKHKHFRTHIEHDDITPHNLHSLLDVFNSRRSVDVTIELQRFADEEDAIAAGYSESQWPPQPMPRVTVATLKFGARITHVLTTPGDSYDLNFQIVGGTEQEVFEEARNFEVPKPRPALPPKKVPRRK